MMLGRGPEHFVNDVLSALRLRAPGAAAGDQIEQRVGSAGACDCGRQTVCLVARVAALPVFGLTLAGIWVLLQAPTAHCLFFCCFLLTLFYHARCFNRSWRCRCCLRSWRRRLPRLYARQVGRRLRAELAR